MTTSNYAELDALIESLGIEYTATFVPQKVSRNADEDRPSLNWAIVLKRGKALIRTDYMQGIGHVPDYTHSRRTYELRQLQDAQNEAANTGTYPTQVRYFGGGSLVSTPKRLPAPLLRDVLCSLILDANGIDESFEDWAGNYGYDTDSRKAEAIYNACREIAAKLKRMFTAAELEALQTAYQDY